LTIISSQRLAPGQVATKIIESGRLTIGRGNENDWVLPDPGRELSKSHCFIEGEGDAFRVTDTSTNGVYVGSGERPIGRNNSCVLHHGDHLRLGKYELAIDIGPGRMALGDAGEPSLSLEAAGAGSLFCDEPVVGTDPFLDHAQLRPDALRKMTRSGSAELELGPPIDQPFEPPRAAPEISEEWPSDVVDAAAPGQPSPDIEIPEDWDQPASADPPRTSISAGQPNCDPFDTEVQALMEPARNPAPAADPGDAGTVAGAVRPRKQEQADLFAAFLAGAGLKPADVNVEDPAEALYMVGQTWRVAVQGIIDIMESRRAIKSEFRIDATQFRHDENNPLKFSLGVEETLRMLVGPQQKGWLPAKQAFAEAMADISQHQVAVLVGMQTAWNDLMKRLDPQALEKRLGEESGLSGLLTSRKARCWDIFSELYAGLAEEGGQGFEGLFGRKFSEGYERQSKKHSVY
jgi:type VI secretion system protein